MRLREVLGLRQYSFQKKILTNFNLEALINSKLNVCVRVGSIRSSYPVKDLDETK